MIIWKGENADEPKAQTARAYPSFFSMKHTLEYCYSPPGWDANPSQGQSPSSMLLVPIYTPLWRETKWCKVPCLRKQRNGRDRPWLSTEYNKACTLYFTFILSVLILLMLIMAKTCLNYFLVPKLVLTSHKITCKHFGLSPYHKLKPTKLLCYIVHIG